MRNSIAADPDTALAREAMRLPGRPLFVAVGIANRLSALLTDTGRPESEKSWAHRAHQRAYYIPTLRLGIEAADFGLGREPHERDQRRLRGVGSSRAER